MKFKIEFGMDNAAFEEQAEEVSRILTETAHKVRHGEDFGNIRDINGNRIGEWSLAD